MSDFYVYLISSLPMLHFEGKPPFSFEAFLSKCSQFIPQKDLEVLKGLRSEGVPQQKSRIIRKVSGFETLLRNELVNLRAARKKIPAEKYLRPDGYAGSSIYHIAVAAQRNPSPLEAEKILDQAKWSFLDELAFGHYFDPDSLVIYALKLLILERWEKIHNANKQVLLEKLITANR
ncbi:MAG: DUF2764 family protein [Candidatus Omnitrophica bacterium]|nr:DUF2764 family protein [Candidatus Omnitrophota bacterium]